MPMQSRGFTHLLAWTSAPKRRRRSLSPSWARSSWPAVVDRAHALVRITVTDNGPGIPPGVMPRVFRPFFTTKSRGTGLGLSLVQKIIVTHNGRVTAVNNEDSSGARFVVTLPSAAAKPDGAAH